MRRLALALGQAGAQRYGVAIWVAHEH
jgi:hypothetical protein